MILGKASGQQPPRPQRPTETPIPTRRPTKQPPIPSTRRPPQTLVPIPTPIRIAHDYGIDDYPS